MSNNNVKLRTQAIIILVGGLILFLAMLYMFGPYMDHSFTEDIHFIGIPGIRKGLFVYIAFAFLCIVANEAVYVISRLILFGKNGPENMATLAIGIGIASAIIILFLAFFNVLELPDMGSKL